MLATILWLGAIAFGLVEVTVPGVLILINIRKFRPYPNSALQKYKEKMFLSQL